MMSGFIKSMEFNETHNGIPAKGISYIGKGYYLYEIRNTSTNVLYDISVQSVNNICDMCLITKHTDDKVVISDVGVNLSKITGNYTYDGLSMRYKSVNDILKFIKSLEKYYSSKLPLAEYNSNEKKGFTKLSDTKENNTRIVDYIDKARGYSVRVLLDLVSKRVLKIGVSKLKGYVLPITPVYDSSNRIIDFIATIDVNVVGRNLSYSELNNFYKAMHNAIETLKYLRKRYLNLQ